MLTNSHHPYPASMPPPPMPAFLDPTTISSTKPSININQNFDSPLTALIPPSISPLTSFANLSLLSPALLRSTPPPSLLAPFARPPLNPGMTTSTVPPSRDNNAATWSPLRRHTAALSSTSPLPPLVSPSSVHNDNNFIVKSPSSPPPLTTVPTNDVIGQPVESPLCTPSPPPSPSSLHPETLFIDTNNEIQSTPHSPDPSWRADSPSGDHVNGLDIRVHILNHDSTSESHSEGLEEVQQGGLMTEHAHRESLVLDVNGGDHMDVGVSSSRSRSPALRVCQGDADMVDHFGKDEEKSVLTDIPEYMSGSNQSPTLNDVPSSEPTSSPLSQPPVPDLVSLPTSQHNPTAQYQPALKEEELEARKQQQPLHPPAPKVKMSLRDFALRKKKQREEEMTKSVQDTPSSGGVNLPSIRSESGAGPNGIQANQVERADGESSDGKTVVDEVEVKAVDLGEHAADDLRKQGTPRLSRNMVKDEVVDVPGTSLIKPTATNGCHHPSPPLAPVPALPIQAGPSTFTYPTTTRQSKQELIEQPIPTVSNQSMIMDSTRYAAMYNNSGSISPINPDPHHFQSYSPPRLCQEDGEIGETMDTPLRLPSSFLRSLPAAPPVINRLASTPTTVPSCSLITPPPRGPTSKHFSFMRSVSSSSQIRHSPPTHPRSFNASPPYRQQPPSTSTPPPARNTGVPPTAPRALRQYMSSNRPTPITPTAMTSSYPTSSSTSSSTATLVPSTAIPATSGGRLPLYIPRGPSADRDRGWDVDQTQYARSLSRRNSKEGGHAWGGR